MSCRVQTFLPVTHFRVKHQPRDTLAGVLAALGAVSPATWCSVVSWKGRAGLRVVCRQAVLGAARTLKCHGPVAAVPGHGEAVAVAES